MNKHLKELLMENYQTLGITFNNKLGVDSTDYKVYTFKAIISHTFALGDKVVVSGGDGVAMKVGTVEELHETPQIDFDAVFSYSWVIDTISLELYNEQVAFDANFDSTMVEVERAKKRQELLDQYNDGLPANSKAKAMLDKLVGSLKSIGKKG